MKTVRLTTASFGINQRELIIKTPLQYKDYQIDVVFYNNFNTKTRSSSLTHRLKGKIPKMMEWLAHPGYDYYIWIDSKFTILEGFLEALFQYEDQADIFLFNHPERSSIKDEIAFMKFHLNNVRSPLFHYLNSRYNGESISQQVNLYLADPDYIDNQLFSLGCFMYSKALIANKNNNIMKDWLLHNVLYSLQDQLSLPYLLQIHKVKYKVYSENLLDNDFLIYN